MTISLAALAFMVASGVSPVPAHAAAPRYQFMPGETLRFLIQRDPYFDDPKGAIETVSDEDYKPPIVERLTEQVQEVKADGTATLLLTLTPEPGFEDEERPQRATSRIVVVSPWGKVLSVSGAALGDSPAEQDLLRGIVLLSADMHVRKDGLAVETRLKPVVVTQSTSPDHDGTLQQTTSAAQAERFVFDCRRGQLVREVCTLTITLSLVMTGRGRRGSDDFGHVVPNAEVVQTLTIERQAN